MNAIIQGLWVGSELSMMEQLSITSFLRHGHDYHLYVYGDVAHVPEGAVIRDGNAILPASMIFQYKHRKSYSGFSNYFRYKLLLENGGWWADMDIVCLKPFDFDTAYVFSSEWYRDSVLVSSGIIKVPVGSEVMAYAWQTCLGKNRQELKWGEIGPRLMDEAVRKFVLDPFIMPSKVFNPIGFKAWDEVLDPTMVWAFDETTYAIHLWNEMWRQDQQDKNRRYHPDCLYEQLTQRYLRG
ncbi:MAG: hypothetical protein IH820_15795 [Bacteroidetes bacterium]|nr:hypothetical protein [Bacteroidota bacterium]